MKVALKFKRLNEIQDHSLSVGDISSIGRSSKCDVQLSNDEKVSSRHCKLLLKIDRLEIMDLDSKNGTYLNGIRIELSEVFLGDQIKIGDTIITLEETRCDSEAKSVLTFPGPSKDRISYELKADFTGARIKNQLSKSGPDFTNATGISHAREVDLRKKIHSKIKLSKQEIRTRNKFLSILSTLLDIAAMFVILILPIMIIPRVVPAQATNGQRFTFLLMLELVLVGIFFISNFKVSKFTIGERLTGIRKIYLDQ
jgi:hypothetical protein